MTALAALYYVVLAVLCVYGAHRTWLMWAYYRGAAPPAPTPAPGGVTAPPPRVLVQLPMYNERFVAERVIEAAAALRWPRERLEIQVLDDSTDATRAVAAAAVGRLAARGLRAAYLPREDRAGFKAGALAAGLRRSDAELVAVFDADFVPSPDFLERTVGVFADPRVGMVQMRWGHLNAAWSLLTRIQAAMLEGHFLFESCARFRAGRLFNFNGTAGIWRRAAIEDAGGWAHDTLTEDLDLSYRAQLRGWRFVFLRDPVCPAELPVDMNGFKGQQRRWTKGGVQTARKLLPAVLRSGDLSAAQKLEAAFHLTNGAAYVLLLLLCCLRPLVVPLAPNPISALDLPVLLVATVSLCTFYALAQKEAGVPLLERLLVMPMVMAAGIGLSLSNSAAVLGGLGRRVGEFVRTPKHAVLGRRPERRPRRSPVYRPAAGWLPFGELALGAWFAATAWRGAAAGDLPALLFYALFGAGFLYVGALSAAGAWPSRAADPVEPAPASA